MRVRVRVRVRGAPPAVERPDGPKSKISLPRLKFMERDMPADIAPPKPQPPVRRKRRALP